MLEVVEVGEETGGVYDVSGVEVVVGEAAAAAVVVVLLLGTELQVPGSHYLKVMTPVAVGLLEQLHRIEVARKGPV